MRTTVPEAFDISFAGSEGVYTISFSPIDRWDGRIDVSIIGRPMEWAVVNADREDDGRLVLGGMTTGSKAIWGDEFWFELRLNDDPPTVRYWGDKVIWREDRSFSPNGS